MKRSKAKLKAVYHQVVIAPMNMKTLTLILYQIVILMKKILVIQKMMRTLKMMKLEKETIGFQEMTSQMTILI